MKSLVVYSSKSGNTKKVAEAVYNNIPDDKEIFAIGDAPDPAGYDFVAVGFWLQAGQPDPVSQEYFAKIGEGQDVFLFATHGAAVGSPHAEKAMDSAKSMVAKGHVVATYSCAGQVAEKFLEVAAKKDPQPPWLADAPAAVGHPDDMDLKHVARLIEELDMF
ncbi:MAG: flavodoxin family protein [Desulfocapsa sp.]|nr:flavodoxin family protein [Desulfocapsa sp.]